MEQVGIAERFLTLDGCIVWNEHNTVFGSNAVCTQAVYFPHSTMPSVTCLRLRDVSVICRVAYFKFHIQSVFLPCCQPGSTATYWFTQYLTSDVAENLGQFLIRSVHPRRIITGPPNGPVWVCSLASVVCRRP